MSAARAEYLWATEGNAYTPSEEWHVERKAGRAISIDTHWYESSADFARRYLKVAGAGKLLSVASPIFEARELADDGWDVTYLDVRKPPRGVKWVKGDASKMPFADGSFDALSSSCVICHVGLGRYGDEKSNSGDMDMMRECRRVLKPGALAQITLPIVDSVTVYRVGNCHRVYPAVAGLEMAEMAGFKVERYAIWATLAQRWMTAQDEPLSRDLNTPDYMSLLLRA